MTVQDLTQQERTVFAGSLVKLVQAEGSVQDGEVAGIEALRDVFGFDDLDEHIDQFQEAVAHTHEQTEHDRVFESLAKSVTRPEVQQFILARLDEVSRMDGYRDQSEEAFLSRLRSLWGLDRA